jgi:hypothetical protein
MKDKPETFLPCLKGYQKGEKNKIKYFVNCCPNESKEKLDKRDKRCILVYIDKREVSP